MSSILSSMKSLGETLYASYDRLQTATEPYELQVGAALGTIMVGASVAGFGGSTESSLYIDSVIHPTYQAFFDGVGLRRDIALTEGKFEARGVNCFTFSRATIQVQSRLFHVNKGAFGFFLKHEVGHIIHNDMLIGTATPMIASLGIQYLAKKYFDEYKTTKSVGTWTVSIGLAILTGRCQEARADDFAIAHSTNEELIGGRKAFIAIHSLLQSTLASTPLLLTSSGEDLSDVLHPSWRSRIAKIETALQKRGLPLEPISDAEKNAIRLACGLS